MAVLPQIFRRQQIDPALEQQQQATQENQQRGAGARPSDLVAILVVLLLVIISLSGLIFYVRHRRRRLAALRQEATSNGQHERMGAFSNVMVQQQPNMSLRAPAAPAHRRAKSLSTPPDSPIFAVGEGADVLDEKRMEAGSDAHSPSRGVPQIHLTFPEAVDEKSGKRESKVVVVTVSEKGSVGLRPLEDQTLPPYSARDQGMKSLDLERIGGLKEQKH